MAVAHTHQLRAGDHWLGIDGTEYLVVEVEHVRGDQPRWWFDVPPLPGDRTLGPGSPSRLHLLPRRMFGTCAGALVLAS